jgi:hypothetical protein
MHPCLVRFGVVGLIVVGVPVTIARGQAAPSSGPTLHFIVGADVQNWQGFSNVSTLGVAGGIGLDVPLRSRISLRGDVGLAYFGHSLMVETSVDCAPGPCPQQASRISTVNGALDLVIRGPVGDRMYLIAGASAHRSTEMVDRGHRDALAADVGMGMRMSANWRLETVLQKLTRPVGRTQWMLPVRFRLRL